MLVSFGPVQSVKQNDGQSLKSVFIHRRVFFWAAAFHHILNHHHQKISSISFIRPSIYLYPFSLFIIIRVPHMFLSFLIMSYYPSPKTFFPIKSASLIGGGEPIRIIKWVIFFSIRPHVSTKMWYEYWRQAVYAACWRLERLSSHACCQYKSNFAVLCQCAVILNEWRSESPSLTYIFLMLAKKGSGE